ncbi:asparaginase [Candidatus Curtissbacteria bacterium]|nr:asparaginase [Candidatus Curtissbacteria bacterium]
MAKILVVTTGGTIDSLWDPGQDSIVVASESQVPTHFKNGSNFKFVATCRKDSRELTGEDREKIREEIDNSAEKKVLITHGLYTLLDTAQYLEARLTNKEKSVVLTGSKTPLKGFENSDAPANLDFAVKSLGTARPGIYLALDERLLTLEKALEEQNKGTLFSANSAQVQ